MRLINADALMMVINNRLNEMTRIGISVDGSWLWECLNDAVDNAPTVDAISLDTKIVIQMYNEEHEEWANEIMTIQELLDSGMCEIYREELRDQYE